jgi:hypothetical protein
MGRALLAGSAIDLLSGDDGRMLGFYIGGFVVAGAVVGVLRPALRTKEGIYAAMVLGGAIVMNAIAIANDGWSAMTRGDWILMTESVRCSDARSHTGSCGMSERLDQPTGRSLMSVWGSTV